MGNSNGRVIVPENEFTISATMLKEMGVKVVVFSFEDVILRNTDSDWSYKYTIPFYTDDEREKLAHSLSERSSQDAMKFIVSLLVQGVGVVVNANNTSKNNGNEENGMYVYGGVPLVSHVLTHYLGEEVTRLIHFSQFKNWKNVFKKVRKSVETPNNVFLIHDDPKWVKNARNNGCLSMLVKDHRIGFRL